MIEWVIAEHPPNDGRDWHCQCARCGGEMEFVGGHRVCGNTPERCESFPGNEQIKRGTIEWFTFDSAQTGGPL